MTADTIYLTDAVGGRLEVDIAADAVWSLFAAGLLPLNAATISAAIRAARIPLAKLQEAQQRHERRYVERPRPQPARARHRNAPHHPNIGPALASKIAAKNPTSTTRICSRCQEELPVGQFGIKDKKTGARKSMCRPCMLDYQRHRYLGVEKQRLLNAARLTFVVTEADDVAGLACSDCGAPIRAGQEVEGDATLHHAICPLTPMPGPEAAA